MRRRDFLYLLGSATAGVTLGSLGLGRVLPPSASPVPAGSGDFAIPSEREVVSICGGCAAGCSVRLRIVDDRLVGIRGNPLCPVGNGGVCARGISEIEAFYDPDRLLGPVVREGDRGSGRWKRISWEEGLSRVASALSKIVREGGGERIGAVFSSGKGSTSAIFERFLGAMGSPHLYHVTHLRDEAALPFAAHAFGETRPYGYDLRHADLVLSFNTPLLEGWLSPVYVAHAFGRGRRRKGGRLAFLHLSSRLSPTAMRADRWIRCAPGGEPLVALGIASAMLREKLVDREALQGIQGLDPWIDAQGVRHPGLRTRLIAENTPHEVARKTGVSETEILALARRFAAARAPVAIGEQTAGSAGIPGLGAVHLLNALRGRIGAPGGVFVAQEAPVEELPGKGGGKRLDAPPATPLAGTPIWRALEGVAAQGGNVPFDLLFLEDGAALGDLTKRDGAAGLLGKIPLIVSFATSLDRSAEFADIILPATTRFEEDCDVEVAAAGAFTAVAAAHRALGPLLDGRPIAETALALGKRLSLLPPGFPKDAGEAVEHRLGGLFRSNRGMPYGTPFRRAWTAEMERAGWRMPEAQDERSFVARVFEAGGWVDPSTPGWRPSPHRPFRLAVAGMKEGEDPLHPETTAPPVPVGVNLLLVPVPVGAFAGRGTPNRPSLLEIAAPHVHGAYRVWAEFHPQDATRLGIEEGAAVTLSNGKAQIVASARITAGIRPGTVAVPFAPTAGGEGRFAAKWGPGAEALFPPPAGPFGGFRIARPVTVTISARREA
ncbi:MAG: hypothetical protein D6795_12595 [Deltaproteobacteria bacterium]|nr:MAG: hypothetical protein D6795_12595 [Deltaproteobacteria bacterium]